MHAAGRDARGTARRARRSGAHDGVGEERSSQTGRTDTVTDDEPSERPAAGWEAYGPTDGLCRELLSVIDGPDAVVGGLRVVRIELHADGVQLFWEDRCPPARDPELRRRLWLDDDVGTRYTESSGSVSRLPIADRWTETGRMTCGPAVPAYARTLRFADPTRTVVVALTRPR